MPAYVAGGGDAWVGFLTGRWFDESERDANPIGMVRTAAMSPRAAGAISVAGLPGTWEVLRSWDESGVWMHEIRRIR